MSIQKQTPRFKIGDIVKIEDKYGDAYDRAGNPWVIFGVKIPGSLPLYTMRSTKNNNTVTYYEEALTLITEGLVLTPGQSKGSNSYVDSIYELAAAQAQEKSGAHTGFTGKQLQDFCQGLEKAKLDLIKDPNTTTVRADGGKPMVDLLPPKALLLMAQVLTRGADKYGRVNWQPGMAWSRCYASCLRHLFAWWSGETNDPETGLNHLAHAACNILFLLEYTDKGTGTDDRIYNAHP